MNDNENYVNFLYLLVQIK